MLICHHGHQAAIYATWAQTNSSNCISFPLTKWKRNKSCEYKENWVCRRCLCNQCGLDLRAAKGGGTHLTWWAMTLQSSWCVHHIVWWWGHDGIHYWLSIKNQTPWDWGCLLWAQHFRCLMQPYFHSFYCHCCLGIPQISYDWCMLSPYQMQGKT